MKKIFCSAAFCLGLLGGNVSQAAVLNFDDLLGNTTAINSQSANYGGFNWDNNFYVYSDTSYAGYGNTYGSPSGENAVFNASGAQTVSLSNGSTFDFNGAYFTGWAANNDFAWHTSTNITVEGYNGADFIGSATMNLLANGYSWLQADLLGVTSLRFIASGTQWWLMDNFTFNENVNAVPVPAAVWLFASGLMGLMGFNRKRAQSAA